MRLKISNFARIADADICIDGLTVIAGQNNTGKSTIGKVLFSIFNSVKNLDDKIMDQVERDLFQYIYNSLQNIGKFIYCDDNESSLSISHYRRKITSRLIGSLIDNIESIKDESDIRNIIRKFCFDYINNIETNEIEDFITDVSKFVSSRFFSSRELLSNEVVSRLWLNILNLLGYKIYRLV